MSLNLIIKAFLSEVLYHTGVLNLIKACRQRNKAFVLMYHRVIGSLKEEDIFIQPGMYVKQITFRRQISFLKKHFDVLPLVELINRIENGRDVERCCSITFDDGWYDNYTYAFPVLKEFELPATIFLATGFIGSDRIFWPEEIAFYLKQQEVLCSAKYYHSLKSLISKIYKEGDEEARLDQAINLLKKMPPYKREEILEDLRSICPVTLNRRLLMNWKEARHMLSSGLISFGAHTDQHVILDQVSLDQARHEIQRSRKALEERLDIIPTLFAYPNGNHTSSLKNILREYGFRVAVTTRKGWFGRQIPLFEIPRIGIHEDVSCTIPLFFARILFDRI